MKKTKIFYDESASCNKCSGLNQVTIIDTINGTVCECSTVCTICGFEDHWAYGSFESRQDGYNASKKYSFD